MIMIASIILLFLADQKSKNMAIKHLKHKGKKQKGPLVFLYVENKGAVLGFLKKYPRLLKMLHIFTLLLITYLFFQEKKALGLKAMGYILILGGGLGNLYDRFKRNYVVDFFSLKFKKIPYFNLADLFVINGLMMLIISGL